jgi:Ca2+:H+ antiporter
VIAIVPLAAFLSLATEAVAGRTVDVVGGLLNATLGNLTEIIICLTALRAENAFWSRPRSPVPS